MLYAIVPVTNGEPDLDWANPPLESYQLNDTERFCIFKPGTQVLANWTIITEAEYLAGIPTVETHEPTPQPTNAEIAENQLIIMDALATLYETVTGGGA